MTDYQRTGSVYVPGPSSPAPVAQPQPTAGGPTQRDVAQLGEQVQELRTLLVWTLIFAAAALFFAIVGAVTSAYSAYVIHAVVQAIHDAVS